MLELTRRTAAVALVLLGVVVFVVLLLPKLFGWSSFVVTSGSMAPTFDTGAVVVTTPVTTDEIAVRDIVTYRDPSGHTTHRVVGMEASSIAGERSRTFLTQGDANEEADPTALDPRNVVGKAKFAVPHLGYVIAAVKAPLGAGALAALFLFVVFTGGNRPRAEADAARATVPDEDARPVELATS